VQQLKYSEFTNRRVQDEWTTIVDACFKCDVRSCKVMSLSYV